MILQILCCSITGKIDGINYNIAYLPEDFDVIPNEDFDPVYMGKLFDRGYQLAKNIL